MERSEIEESLLAENWKVESNKEISPIVDPRA